MSDQTIHWKRLRLKGNTTDDTNWRGTQVSPHRVTFSVGGTATAGAYSFRIQGQVVTLRGAQKAIDQTVTFTRVGQTNAQIAAALETNGDANAELAKLGIVIGSSSTDVTVDFPPGAEVFFTLAAPAPGTLMASEPLLPIVSSAPVFAGATNDVGSVEVMVLAKDDAGATLLAPGTGTQTSFSLEVIEIAVVKDVSTGGVVSYRQVIGGTTALASQELCRPITVPVRGAGYWTIRLHTFANAVSGTDSYEVIWREGGTT